MPGTPLTSAPMPSPRIRQTTGSSGNVQVPFWLTARVPAAGALSLSNVGAVMVGACLASGTVEKRVYGRRARGAIVTGRRACPLAGVWDNGRKSALLVVSHMV